MKIFENEFIVISIEESNNLYVENWLPATKNMTKDQWKETRLKLRDAFLQYKTDKLLTLTKEFYFAITPELQEWLAEKVTKEVGHLIKKIALIIPTSVIAEMGVEQLMEEKETGKLLSKYFDDEQEARKWLFE